MQNLDDNNVELKLDEADSEAKSTTTRLTHQDVFEEARKTVRNEYTKGLRFY